MLHATDTTPSHFLTSDHRACDGLWAALEGFVEDGDREAARVAFDRFRSAMLLHFEREEQRLFPPIEAAMGMPAGAGPTAVMRMEHTQMRGVLDQMASCAAAGDWQDVVDHGDTLLMLIQQHNVKEEGILYPMADRALATQWQTVARGWTLD